MSRPRTKDRAPAVGYARVSSLEQAQQGISLEVQEQKIRAYAALHDLPLSDVLIDAGESGKDLKRPAMRELLARIRSGEVGAVIVFKLDRLTRSPRDLYFLVDDELNPREVDLVSITEQIDTRTPAGRAMLGMMSVFAQMERELIAERTRTALQAKKDRGERLGGEPLGFGDQQELEAVRRILSLRRSGKSFGEIARKLTTEGIPTKRGGRWDPSTVRYVWGRRREYEPLLRPARNGDEMVLSSMTNGVNPH